MKLMATLVPLCFGTLLHAIATLLSYIFTAVVMFFNSLLACRQRANEDTTFCGCLLDVAVAVFLAWLKLLSWFSVLTEESDTISNCTGAWTTRVITKHPIPGHASVKVGK